MMTEEALLAAEAQRRGLSVVELKMQMAVGDEVVRNIVTDSRRGICQSTSLIPRDRNEPERPPARAVELPIQPPPGIASVDRIAQAFDARERRRR
jgi:hypothetical protein